MFCQVLSRKPVEVMSLILQDIFWVIQKNYKTQRVTLQILFFKFLSYKNTSLHWRDLWQTLKAFVERTCNFSVRQEKQIMFEEEESSIFVVFPSSIFLLVKGHLSRNQKNQYFSEEAIQIWIFRTDQVNKTLECNHFWKQNLFLYQINWLNKLIRNIYDDKIFSKKESSSSLPLSLSKSW